MNRFVGLAALAAACGVDDAPPSSGSTGATSGTTVSTSTMSTSSGPTATPDDPTMGPGPETTTGTDTETTGDPGCETNDDCMDADAPFCADDGSCVPCDGMPNANAACAELDPSAPVCDDSQCVQCTEDNATACGDQTPVCNVDDNLCVGCTEHTQCPDSACHLDGADAGGCFDEGDVYNASTPTELNTRISTIGDGQGVIVLAAGDYNQTANIAGEAEIALLGPSGAVLSGTAALPNLNVGETAIAYVGGPSVADGDTGVSCSGTAVWLDDSSVSGNNHVGVDISGGCAAHLRRTVVSNNGAGGISASGASSEVRLVNSAIVGNTNTDSVAAIALQSSAGIVATYSTIADNFAGIGDTDSIVCSGSAGAISNSIIVGTEANSISGCGGVTFDNNAVDASSLGGSNINVGAHNDAWFANPSANDFGITTAGETVLMNIAQWQEGDPLTDIDGEPVPTDSRSFPGYDQP